MKPKRLVIGISGASGIIYGVRLLQLLKDSDIETHLIITQSAQLTLHYETSMSLDAVTSLADQTHPVKNIGASIASGSFRSLGMIIAPCSIRSMSEIATGVTSNLLTRAADVTLKERRKLVLMVRETPLHTGHLRTMTQLSEIGAIIAPPVPSFYTQPKTLDDMITQTVGRVLDLFDIDLDIVQRWQPENSTSD
ncbi:MAG: 3-octaprenyl-4-hydroxybenzoate carboxy-lyase [Alteromonadaceae bacterium]|nr:MAG: 3-octaprenyl-4-hydroxybenzoate carboxy-lyase [Alteromonadaceae bacterium]